MSGKFITGDCSNCESSYTVEYIEELVATDYPEHCPFCGELIEEITEEYIDDEDSDDDEQWD